MTLQPRPLNLKCQIINQSIYWKQGAWVPVFKVFHNINYFIKFLYVSWFYNRFNDLPIIISSHFMPQNVTLLRSLFLLYFTGRGKRNFRVSNLIPWEICKIDFYPYLLGTLLQNLVEKTSTNFELVSLKTLDFISIFLRSCFFLVDLVYIYFML